MEPNLDGMETAQVLAVAKAAYPNWDLQPETVAVWQQQLAGEPARLVMDAVLEHVAASKWPPTIAEVFERLVDVRERERFADQVAEDRLVLVERRRVELAMPQGAEPRAVPKITRRRSDPRLAQDGTLLLTAEERMLIEERRLRAKEALDELDGAA